MVIAAAASSIDSMMVSPSTARRDRTRRGRAWLTSRRTRSRGALDGGAARAGLLRGSRARWTPATALTGDGPDGTRCAGIGHARGAA